MRSATTAIKNENTKREKEQESALFSLSLLSRQRMICSIFFLLLLPDIAMGLYWQLHEHAQTKEKREIKNKKKKLRSRLSTSGSLRPS